VTRKTSLDITGCVTGAYCITVCIRSNIIWRASFIATQYGGNIDRIIAAILEIVENPKLFSNTWLIFRLAALALSPVALQRSDCRIAAILEIMHNPELFSNIWLIFRLAALAPFPVALQASDYTRRIIAIE